MKKALYLIIFIFGLYLVLASISGNSDSIAYEILSILTNIVKRIVHATGLDYIIKTFKEFI